jgi:hypothetical protein
MSSIVPFAGGKVPAIFRDIAPDADDLSAGVASGFAVVSFRASKWRIKYQGEEHPVLNAEGDPMASLEVVLLRANPHITKNFYKTGYSEGAAEAPDCYSLDGLRPDEGSKLKQAKTCASCPQNVFGSRITPSGKKAKACQDNRRLAVVPVNDIDNETFGGPMLLRVPAASLADLALMGKNLKARGFPYNAVSVRIGFDMDASYPKLTFKPIRPVTEDEAVKIKTLLSDDKLTRILAEAVELVAGTENDTAPVQQEMELASEPADTLFEQAPVKAKPKGRPPGAKAAAKPAPAADPAPANDLEGDSQLDSDIKGILAELGDLT